MITNTLWDKTITNDQLLTKQTLFRLNPDQLIALFSIKIKKFYDFLLITHRSEKEEMEKERLPKEEFDVFMNQVFGSKIMYEASCNEIQIIDYIDQELTMQEQYLLGKVYTQCLNARLTLMTDKTIYYYFCFNDEILNLRFYQDWENTPNYGGDIEIGNEPIAIYSSEEIPTSFVKIN